MRWASSYVAPWQITTRFLREKLIKDIGTRLSNFCSEMGEKKQSEFFLSLPLIWLDAWQNLHGCTTEFAWTQEGICMGAQWNWFLWEKLIKDIGIRFSNFCSEMRRKKKCEFFFVFVTHLHGRMTEFAWMHNRICMDARRNLHGGTTELAWTKNRILLGHITFSFLAKKIHLYLFYSFCVADLNLMDLGHNQQRHPTVHTVGVSRGRVRGCGCWC